MSNSEEHQRLRELLGSYTLGHLDEADEARVRAHLDGCASCRDDLAEIEPLTGLLDLVDARRFDLPELPPRALGASIREAVADERVVVESDELAQRRERARRRTTTRAVAGAVAAAVVVGALVGGVTIGRSTAPETAGPAPAPTAPTTPGPSTDAAEAPAPEVPVEAVDVAVVQPRVSVSDAGLIDHTWGVELLMTGRGFERGEVFQAAFRDRVTGELVTAGAFLGTGRRELVCRLQSGLLRADASEVVVTDDTGDVVLAASL